VAKVLMIRCVPWEKTLKHRHLVIPLSFNTKITAKTTWFIAPGFSRQQVWPGILALGSIEKLLMFIGNAHEILNGESMIFVSI